MSTRPNHLAATVALVGALALAACDGGVPTEGALAAHDHEGVSLADLEASASLDPEIRKTIARLRQMSATFHDVDKAAEAGYSVNIGCIDETVAGVDPSVARGMGYHVTRGDVDLIGDGVANLYEPELLVYAPHPLDAQLPKEERLRKARLIAFDYYVPAATMADPDTPPEFFGEPFDWSEPFQGWVRHIYLWGNNPEGMFENYNAAVPLCTELLNP